MAVFLWFFLILSAGRTFIGTIREKRDFLGELNRFGKNFESESTDAVYG